MCVVCEIGNFLGWAWIPSAPALAGQSMAARGSHVLALLPSVALRQCRFITIFVGGNCLAAWPTLPCLGATDECKGLCNPCHSHPPAHPAPRPTVDASADAFRFYAGGIFHLPDCKMDPKELDHAVILR